MLGLIVADLRAKRAAADPGQQPLSLVLMSATADAELFSGYMQQQQAFAGGGAVPKGLPPPPPLPAAARSGESNVGMLTIPGFTYPVREFYLEDILEQTGHVIGRGSR